MNRTPVIATVLAALAVCGFGSVSPAADQPNAITFSLEQPQQNEQNDCSQPRAFMQKPGEPDPLCQLKGEAITLMDAETGQTLYARNPDKHLPNASTTKIMTAILMIEHVGLNDRIKASKNVTLTPYTSLNLRLGETITMIDLLNGLLIRSANDAAVAAAEHIAGTVPKFAAMMNAKASELGCKNTNFVTPNGLYAPNHYSSAYDLCIIARYAFRYPTFNEVIKTKRYTLNSRSKNREDLVVFSKSKFLKYYKYADGVKSGYLKQAGRCYVGSATKDGWRLVSCILKSPDAYGETAVLMDWGYKNFRREQIAQSGEAMGSVKVKDGANEDATLVAQHALSVVVPKNAKITIEKEYDQAKAPISRGKALGMLVAKADGVVIAQTPLVAASDVQLRLSAKAAPWAKGAAGLLVVGMVVGYKKYGTTLAKNSVRRRDRFTSAL